MKNSTARQLIRERADAITEFLRTNLATYPVAVHELEEIARTAGHLGKRQSITRSKRFLAAKKALGIRSIRTGFGASAWRWRLPQARVTISSSGPKSVEAAVPPDWAEGIAHLAHLHHPGDVPAHRWDRFVAKTEWAVRAARLGWDALRLFGCSRRGTLVHPGSAGLVWTLAGGKLLELHRDWAVIEAASNGSRRVFERRSLKTAKLVLPWEEGSHPVTQ